MYLNIAEVIADNLLGRAIIGKPLALELTENDVKDIESRCKSLTADSITLLLEKGLSAYYKAISSPPLYMICICGSMFPHLPFGLAAPFNQAAQREFLP